MKAPRNSRGPPWTIEHDPNYNSFYYFNAKTGESEWVEDELVTDEIELTTMSAAPVTTRQAPAPAAEESDDDDDDDDDEGGNSTTTSDGIDLISDEARVKADTQADINSHYRCLLLTACVLEAPMAVVEGLCRSSAFALCGLACVLVAAGTRSWAWAERAQSCAREAALTLAAALTLVVVPCSACCVYRRYDGDEDWDLAPLPTLLGWVDASRFSAFALGGGSLAQQRRRQGGEAAGAGGGDLEEAEGGSGGGDAAALLDFHEPRSLDSWQGQGLGLLVAPRRVFRSLWRIAQGDEPGPGPGRRRRRGR